MNNANRRRNGPAKREPDTKGRLVNEVRCEIPKRHPRRRARFTPGGPPPVLLSVLAARSRSAALRPSPRR